MKTCLYCGKKIKKRNKFCNSSCSAKYNNSKRKLSQKTKDKISESLKGKNGNTKLFGESNGNWSGGKGEVNVKCQVCNKSFIAYKRYSSDMHRTTCSRECQTIAVFNKRKYRNGKKKFFTYENKLQGEIILESSWEFEIAKYLDEKQIKWIRPKPLKWIDKKGKNHLYFPDFYLPDRDLYLDPKNPFCMEQDKEKMKCIEQLVNIEYGSLKKIKRVVGP